MKTYKVKNYKGNLVESLSKFQKSHKGMKIVEAVEDGDDLKIKAEESEKLEEAAGKKVYLIIFDNTIAGIASSKPIAKKMAKELEDSEGDADIQEFDFDILVSDDERINVDL